MRLLDFLASIRHIQGDEMAFGQILLRCHDLIDDPVLPVVGQFADVRFVADLVIEVVVVVQFLDYLADQGQLNIQDLGMFQR